MKILYLSSSIIPSSRANSIQIMNMCAAFAEAGHEVILAAPWIVTASSSSTPKTESVFNSYDVSHNFRIVWMPCLEMPGKPIQLLPQIISLLYRERPDLVFGRFLFGCYLAAILGWATSYESHCPDWQINRVQAFLYGTITRFRSYRGTVVISQVLKGIFEDHYGKTDVRYCVAHDAAKQDKTQAEPETGVQNSVRLGYVGSLGRGKGIDLILEIGPRVPDVDIVVAGGDSCLVAQLAEKASRNIKFLGFVQPERISNVYEMFDVALLPNQEDMTMYGSGIEIGGYNSPLKLFEYMSYRKAIIASDIPVLREVLNDTNSLLVAPSSTDEWVEAINAMREPSVRQQIATTAHADFCRQYTWTKRVERIMNFLGNE